MPTRFERTIWLVAAAAIGWQVLVPPIVGLAENGDFPKIVRRFDLVAPVADDGDRWFKYVFTRYIFDPASRWDSEFRSSESLLVRAALALNWLVSKDGAFDIRIMGVTHAAIFLGALWLFLPLLRNAGPIRRVVLALVVVLVFCDVMYVCYFNSFYMDAAGFLFLLLASVLFVRGNWIGFLFSCVLLVCAKPVYSILGVPLAVLTFRNTKPVFLARLGAAILILATLSGRFEVPPGYSEGAMFNVVFHGLLPGSAHPSRDLRELGSRRFVPEIRRDEHVFGGLSDIRLRFPCPFFPAHRPRPAGLVLPAASDSSFWSAAEWRGRGHGPEAEHGNVR